MKSNGVRRVADPTENIVVVGAGLAGLAAALRLRGSGRSVTVLERDNSVGGRVGKYETLDYVIDSGASVLTMPNLIAEALDAVGATFDSTDPPLKLEPLSPAYHARFADGTAIDVYSDSESMAAEVAEKCGNIEAANYRRLRAWLANIFDAEFSRFIARNFDSPLDLISSSAARRDLRRLVTLGGFGRLGARVDRIITDPRLRRVFTFQALYAGLPPRKALAAYGAIAHMDTSLGVSFPIGGMHTIAEAMADALTAAGGSVLLGSGVRSIDFADGRATAVITEDGRRHPCDALILTPDLLVVDRLLEPLGLRPRRRPRVSPSAVVVHGTVALEVTRRWPAQAHHTIDFGANWAQTFREITATRGRGKLMSDPSLLITRPALTDPSLRVTREGVVSEPVSILAPCPNLDSAALDWATLEQPYTQEIIRELENRGYQGFTEHLRIDRVYTPETWLAMGMIAGSPFSAAHLFRQTGPFRRRNMVPRSRNIVLAGCGTTPGVGIPTVLISGNLAAERIIGTTNHEERGLLDARRASDQGAR